jgi:hypothetical protein
VIAWASDVLGWHLVERAQVMEERLLERVALYHAKPAFFARAAPAWCTLVRRTLMRERSIADALTISRTGRHSPWDRWRHGDFSLDDPEFDAAFVVRGAPAERVREILSSGVRARLCELGQQADDLALSNEKLAVSVHRPVTDADELAVLVNRVIVLGELLTPSAPARGPYR